MSPAFHASRAPRTISTFSSDIAHAVSRGRVLLFVQSNSHRLDDGADPRSAQAAGDRD